MGIVSEMEVRGIPPAPAFIEPHAPAQGGVAGDLSRVTHSATARFENDAAPLRTRKGASVAGAASNDSVEAAYTELRKDWHAAANSESRWSSMRAIRVPASFNSLSEIEKRRCVQWIVDEAVGLNRNNFWKALMLTRALGPYYRGTISRRDYNDFSRMGSSTGADGTYIRSQMTSYGMVRDYYAAAMPATASVTEDQEDSAAVASVRSGTAAEGASFPAGVLVRSRL